MALPLNQFKSIQHTITTNEVDVYTAPTIPAYTGIVLMIQICNTSNSPTTVSVSTVRGSVVTELVKDFTIPAKDALSPITGKLILEPGMRLRVVAGTTNVLKLTMSVVESAND